MKTPQRATWPEFVHAFDDWYREHAVARPPGPWTCQHCSSVLHQRYCAVSVHHVEFGACTGGGMVFLVLVPYCPQCEVPPGDDGCLHLPYVPSRAPYKQEGST